MATIVLSLHTLTDGWEHLDATTQRGITSWITRTGKDETAERHLLSDSLSGLAYSPTTARISALGLFDIERGEGVVYYVGGGLKEISTEGEWSYKERSEKELLEEFWQGILSYDTIATFNGRAFLVPFILHRSIAHHIKPTVELQKKRYLTQQTMPYHVDLLEELTFYGAMTRRPSLHQFCTLYGIQSPFKALQDDTVANWQKKQAWIEIARHTGAVTVATEAVYQRWKTYLAPASFINIIDF